jgi:lysozyme
VTVPLTQGQHDALVSFTYNEGAGRLQSSTLLKDLNAGNYAAVPAEFMKWVFGGGVKLPGLVTRRRAECKLFLCS